MARWGFVRHGQSVANAERWLAGHVDAPLSALGRAQAEALDIDVAAWRRILSSDLQRAAHTASLAVPGVRVPALAPLRERTVGEWDGRPIAELKAEGHWPTLITWQGVPPGGESNRMLAMRVLAWLAEQPDEDTLIFAHGGVIRSLTGLVDGLPTHEIPLRRVGNCELCVRELAPRHWAQLLASL